MSRWSSEEWAVYYQALCTQACGEGPPPASLGDAVLLTLPEPVWQTLDVIAARWGLTRGQVATAILLEGFGMMMGRAEVGDA